MLTTPKPDKSLFGYLETLWAGRAIG